MRRLTGGFDAIIGNPPWDRMKLQQVEWFAARRREIALAQRAADRKRMIAALETAGDPLARDFAKAEERAEAASRMARGCGDYPLLSGGDMNIYSLFVERATALVKPSGMVGLLTPSGIASDKTAAPFFKGVATGGRLKALYDFENRRDTVQQEPFFPDVDQPLQVLHFVSSAARPITSRTQIAPSFFRTCRSCSDPERCFPLTAEDFARVNPNTGTAPIFRTRRDAASDDRDLRPPAGSGRPLQWRRGQDLAGQIRDHVPHDQRLQPVPHPPGIGRAGRRLSDRRQPLPQRGRGMGAAVRRQDGSSLRSPRRKRRR